MGCKRLLGSKTFLRNENFSGNCTTSIRYEISTFSSVWPFFEEGGRGSRKFRPEAEIFGIFSIEVAPKVGVRANSSIFTVYFFDGVP